MNNVHQRESVGYLSGLNHEQAQAVETTEGAVLVLSGAGTGKTKVLTTRIVHLISSRKAFPGQILSVTFTNKAAKEMTQRVGDMLGDAASGLWIGTFHSICARILRRHAESVNLSSSYTILDDDDQMRILRQIIREQGIDEKRWPPRAFVNAIQSLKDKAITPDKANAQNATFCDGRLAPIYRAYQARLQSLNACDFGDLLLHVLTIFKNHPPILEEYSRRFRYILVDEYQDTNSAQYMWLKLLALTHMNICCVGDDDQSIYSWRGAQIDNILKFEKDFPGAKIVRLQRNYRSTPEILAVASRVISNNAGRMGKTLWTDDAPGEPVRIITTQDDRLEARFVADTVCDLDIKGIPRGEMAVLVRAGYQTRSFEEQFLACGIPYRIIGGLRFYERQEIKDAVSYLRLIHESRDDIAFQRIINQPRRGVGEATLTTLAANSRAGGYSMLEACIRGLKDGIIKGKAREALAKFTDDLKRWQSLAPKIRPSQLLEVLLTDSGYMEMWKQDKSPDSPGRVDNLKELIAAASEFETLEAFLEHTSLVSGDTGEDPYGKVSLMTLHAAKGLEFAAVFLPGWEEGIFPSSRSMEENGLEGLEEERRLAYVGITRARRILYVSHSLSRRVYNQFQYNLPSRFLAEMPDDYIERIDKTSRPKDFGGRMAKIFDENDFVIEVPPEANDSSDDFKPGDKIRHGKFGDGVVLAVSGNKLDVSFKNSGIKKVIGDFLERA